MFADSGKDKSAGGIGHRFEEVRIRRQTERAAETPHWMRGLGSLSVNFPSTSA